MTLKIAWAGPWNHHSAIATFGFDVVTELTADGHRIEVLRTEVGKSLELPALESPSDICHLTAKTVNHLRNDYDVVIANLGDHFGYHGALASPLVRAEAVTIFHDAFMANYCSGWAQQFPNPDLALQAMVMATYGPSAMPSGASYWMPPAEMMLRRPMIELFAGQAMAAIIHAEHYRERVLGACPGPVFKIPLGFRDLCIPAARRVGTTLEIATIGHVNSNKRIAEIIKAIGGSSLLRTYCRYRVIGVVEPTEQNRIETEMRRHGVTEVVFTGGVDNETLRNSLAEVDVICCLRHPILEGGSASLVVAMLSGRPVLVSDHGVYGELPDEVVLKCRPGEEAADVRRHLEMLLEDRGAMWALGERARAFARDLYSPGQYARNLIGVIERAQAGGPAARTCMQFGRILASIDLGGDDFAARAVAETLGALLERPVG